METKATHLTPEQLREQHLNYNYDARQQYWWEQKVGKDFPITWNGMIFIIGLTGAALCLWLIHWISTGVDDYFKERDEKKKRAEALRIEGMRLKRELVKRDRVRIERRKPKFEVVDDVEVEEEPPRRGKVADE